jgi:hypothetical protein
MPGMSGGPAWTELENGGWCVFGIVRGYRALIHNSDEDGYSVGLPGVCIIEPINYVFKRVESDYKVIAVGKP